MTRVKDELFAEERPAADFDFGEKTAAVFDDMLERSIPMYREIQRMMGQLANQFATPDTHVYDLGCSTGITLRTLADGIAANKPVTLIGVDYSQAMLDKARENLCQHKIERPVELIEADLNNPLDIHNASVVVLNLTLQFVRPLNRDQLIRNIYHGLQHNGCLILIEKVLGNDSLFNRLFIDFYYDFKRANGYSNTEIAQKREALENILIPYRVDENIHLLRKNGFKSTEIFFKWYNFCGIIGVKA